MGEGGVQCPGRLRLHDPAQFRFLGLKWEEGRESVHWCQWSGYGQEESWYDGLEGGKAAWANRFGTPVLCL